MRTLLILIKRNVKLFFREKGMFLTSLITPCALLLLYIAFLGNVYRDSFLSSLPEGVQISEELLSALVGGQLISSVLSVSCITVAFSANFLMVQDKARGTVRDLRVSPVSPALLSVGYYIATLLSTLIICLAATAVSLVYVSFVGFYLSVADIFLLLSDVVLLTMLGTAISSVVSFFLSSQGQISAVGTLVSAGYGYICGAYMPIYTFGEGMRRVIMLLPGTYGTSLLRNHAMRGVLAEIEREGMPSAAMTALCDALDCNLYFFGHKVEVAYMYLILAATTLICLGIYVLLNLLRRRERG